MTKIFYVFGTGPSINDVTEEEWEFLKNKHTISMATFPFSSKRLEAYYSHEGVSLDAYMLNIMKDNEYLDTKLFLAFDESLLLAHNLGFRYRQKTVKTSALFLPSRKPWCIDEPNPPNTFKECRAHTFMQPIFRFRGQLSATINIALLLGATEIRLIGVDLNCSRSFGESNEGMEKWIKNPEYLKIAKELYDNGTKALNSKIDVSPMMEGFDENTMHASVTPYCNPKYWGDKKFRGMDDILKWMHSELYKEGMNGIYTTSKESLPFKSGKLQYKSIME
jgi:hypothetical protein